jgi:hypothetical protein
MTRKPTSLDLYIYRKPTATDTTINFLSNHPLEHKLAAYRFFINRMLSLPFSDIQRHEEWKNIKLIAHNNIPIHILTKLRHNAHKKTQPTTHPHSFRERHKMGHLHTLLTACQKNQQPIQNHKCQSYFQKQ